jgi:hypothetical protein
MKTKSDCVRKGRNPESHKAENIIKVRVSCAMIREMFHP